MTRQEQNELFGVRLARGVKRGNIDTDSLQGVIHAYLETVYPKHWERRQARAYDISRVQIIRGYKLERAAQAHQSRLRHGAPNS